MSENKKQTPIVYKPQEYDEEKIADRAKWQGELGPVMLSGDDYVALLTIIEALRTQVDMQSREIARMNQREFWRLKLNDRPRGRE